MNNRDIGFIHTGQDAEIKVDAFNFSRYGLIGGKVVSVSSDAITRDKSADKSRAAQDNASDESSEPANQELVYAARVVLDRTQMQVEDRLVDLSPGMAVTVEIKTGSRRIITYLLSPLLRYGQEALRATITRRGWYRVPRRSRAVSTNNWTKFLQRAAASGAHRFWSMGHAKVMVENE